jgi:small subunit ribosomal protein S5
MTEENNTAPAGNNEQAEGKAGTAHTAFSGDSNNKADRKGGRGKRRERAPREVKEFEEAILKIDRVTRVVKGGRRMRFRITVVIGDKKGRVGFGIGKSAEVLTGIQKAVSLAKKNLITVSMVDGTIPHPANETFKSSRVILLPATEGKGIIAGGAVRKILELAGVRDVLSKSHGSRNKLNIANATFLALESLSPDSNPGSKKKLKEEMEAVDKEAGEKETPKKAVEKKSGEAKPVAKKPVAKKEQ